VHFCITLYPIIKVFFSHVQTGRSGVSLALARSAVEEVREFVSVSASTVTWAMKDAKEKNQKQDHAMKRYIRFIAVMCDFVENDD